MQKNTTTKLKAILSGCRKNDSFAQQLLYEELYSYAMGICLRYAAHKNEAKEMLNDGFFKVFTKFNQYDSDYPFRPWFKVVLVNASIDYLRKKKPLLLAEIENHQSELFEDNIIEEQLVYEDLIKLVQQLPPAYRAVFNLHIIEGYKHHEIADKLNISVGTSKSNLFKAKNKLQGLIGTIHRTKMN